MRSISSEPVSKVLSAYVLLALLYPLSLFSPNNPFPLLPPPQFAYIKNRRINPEQNSLPQLQLFSSLQLLRLLNNPTHLQIFRFCFFCTSRTQMESPQEDGGLAFGSTPTSRKAQQTLGTISLLNNLKIIVGIQSYKCSVQKFSLIV